VVFSNASLEQGWSNCKIGIGLDPQSQERVHEVATWVFTACQHMGFHVLGVDVPFSNYLAGAAHADASHDLVGTFVPGGLGPAVGPATAELLLTSCSELHPTVMAKMETRLASLAFAGSLFRSHLFVMVMWPDDVHGRPRVIDKKMYYREGQTWHRLDLCQTSFVFCVFLGCAVGRGWGVGVEESHRRELVAAACPVFVFWVIWHKLIRFLQNVVAVAPMRLTAVQQSFRQVMDGLGEPMKTKAGGDLRKAWKLRSFLSQCGSKCDSDRVVKILKDKFGLSKGCKKLSSARSGRGGVAKGSKQGAVWMCSYEFLEQAYKHVMEGYL
jgi:hypothetical protein